MRTKIADGIFMVVFMLLLLIPTVLVDPVGGGVSHKENRMLIVPTRSGGVAQVTIGVHQAV